MRIQCTGAKVIIGINAHINYVLDTFLFTRTYRVLYFGVETSRVDVNCLRTTIGF